ncbi:NADH dehydrogenase [ubiquinone] 1 beta subcomplex subunit 1 [Phlebotomus argentipes]|uniref:NADH dehydrogenase [ubiquinone] 1 beta subcomplex subunit 1 n=1 Tax=Phlebotomus argentipes TaxID=94469 RepID=UPI002893166B|nr:NADH dehydrogenase [ubiquinone] 1 beta subcomplex subunit 1 [Phlebotomus argentipes]XP_059609465.1 NADH dehydrogenase [ubiquinone] 1 beta subcomplex subunit 1 [Phlebotomus argentipes]
MVLNSVFGLTTKSVWFAVPMTGFCIGWFLDYQETLRMTRFRDKSALYGRELAPGEQPTWP